MWDDLVAWLQSPGGARVLQTAIIPALAILVAGLLAAAIARSAVRATIRRAERVEATSAVAGLVAAARVTADAEGDLVSSRRAARLRAEADVRVRLLPVAGADLAADWAATRMDALQQQTAQDAAPAQLAELRDRLVEWVGKPARAKRIFSTSAAPTPRPAAAAAEPPAAPKPQARAVEPTQPEASAEPSEQDRSVRPTAAPGPVRTPPPPEPAAEAAPEPEPVGAAAAVPAAAAPSADALPAWQRTRAVERLQQERGRTRGVESPTSDDAEVPLSTAPVAVPRIHRAEAAPAAAPAQPSGQDADEAVRLEAHQQARHARPSEQAVAATGAATGPATGAAAATTPTPAPAWLDTYDDEAQVTQNLDLKTPPPVAATAVRDRGTPGEDLVPRS